ncbi:MAG TPA: DUF1707 domain-containing protein [Micromonosporaceae bacterium]|nr:DUF1707 domain-containing protein [Micromonosporaceae bacterium]
MGSPEKIRDLRVSDQERESAQRALAEHLAAGRLDVDEYTQRVDRCLAARMRSQLLDLFDDLPPPLPELADAPSGGVLERSKPTTEAASGDIETVTDGLGVAAGLLLLIGIPLAAVLGYVYSAWWLLAIPVVLIVALAIIEAIIKYRARR